MKHNFISIQDKLEEAYQLALLTQRLEHQGIIKKESQWNLL